MEYEGVDITRVPGRSLVQATVNTPGCPPLVVYGANIEQVLRNLNNQLDAIREDAKIHGPWK